MSKEQYVNTKEETRTVAIVGMGYVGLPLALLFVQKGFHVLGIDLDRQKMKMLNEGISYITDIQDQVIQAALSSERFTPSNHYNGLHEAEAIIICVPTPLTSHRTPDLSYLTQAAIEISYRLNKGQLVILESSTYPGTTSEVLVPILSQFGLKVGTDFYAGYSPERLDPGNEKYQVQNIPKIISGTTSSCKARVEELYGQVFDQIHSVSSTDAAEMTKILENSYRLINISFMNEMAMICDELKLNVWEIIDAASTKPFGYTPFYPGPGIGGHCIPVDPSYLVWKIKQTGINSDFIQISNAINRTMPNYIVRQLEKHLAHQTLSNSHIIVYGVAYKPDIADYRESASTKLIQLLQQEGAIVSYHDPFVPTLQLEGLKLQSTPLTEEALNKADCVIIATNHSSLPLSYLIEHASFIFDTRNVSKGISGKAKIVRLGGGDD